MQTIEHDQLRLDLGELLRVRIGDYGSGKPWVSLSVQDIPAECFQQLVIDGVIERRSTLIIDGEMSYFAGYAELGLTSVMVYSDRMPVGMGEDVARQLSMTIYCKPEAEVTELAREASDIADRLLAKLTPKRKP